MSFGWRSSHVLAEPLRGLVRHDITPRGGVYATHGRGQGDVSCPRGVKRAPLPSMVPKCAKRSRVETGRPVCVEECSGWG